MTRTLWAALLLLASNAVAIADPWSERPDSNRTPGKARDDLTLDQICNTKWGTDERFVDDAMKRAVIAAYQFNVNACPLTPYKGKSIHRVEIDHLIPRELGGADDVENLWPECYELVNKSKAKQADGAHKKDQLETKLHNLVCDARSSALLAEYRQKIVSDWISLYAEIYSK
jgi:5-methylcytosine-specific restriction endonuclease McrA